MESKRVHFVSLGCPKNRVDTETMLAGLPGARYTITADPDDADVVVVNTVQWDRARHRELLGPELKIP